MAPTLTELGVDTLSTADRLALAEALRESVAADLAAQPIDPELRAELERRVALAKADPGRGIPWEQVRAAAAEARWQR
ncbi:MAG TPA: addiction module protein [Urbifossiella sp.]|jgi:putative addiction module component (TIGR02574 family)|nr:addiction module protein [Urbifossiella sp.]